MSDRILFIPGSFNPITNAHIEMAKIAAEKVKAYYTYFIPAHDTYVARKRTLIPGNVRCSLIDLAVPDDLYMSATRYEVASYLPTKTYETINALKSNGNEYFICLGMDNIKTLTTWYNWQKFVEENQFVACVRNGENLEETLAKCGLENYKDHFTEIEIPENNISSSLVRKLCEEGRFDEVKNLVPKNVYEYLEEFYARI